MEKYDRDRVLQKEPIGVRRFPDGRIEVNMSQARLPGETYEAYHDRLKVLKKVRNAHCRGRWMPKE